jgi:putative phosphoesterase
MTTIGVISDTHGLLRPEAAEALRGVAHILHAGDVGAPEVLEELRTIAPVTAVRGNVDHGQWARELPLSETAEFGGVSIYVLHILDELDLKPEAAGFEVVVYGHSHKPSSEIKNGVLYFNPGSAGPRRFKLPVTVGRLVIDDGKVRGEIVEIGRKS